MSKQDSFDFARDKAASPKLERRASEEEINKKLRYMQSLPESDPLKDVLANEILEWVLSR